MKLKFLHSIALIVIIASCQSSSKENKEMVSEVPKKLTANEKWMHAINTNDMQLLESLYIEDTFVLSKNGVDVQNRGELLDLVKQSDFKVNSVNTLKRLKANANYDYEIGEFANKDGNLMKHLVIWNTTNDKEKRELEFLAEVDTDTVQLDGINKQRRQWMALCNAHDVKSLIEQMYTENTMYYNRGRLLKGREELINEYQYMSNSEYKLSLEPILVEPVSNTMVYEFGQCKGSYNGKYILIWQKNREGVWQILFDSNI